MTLKCTALIPLVALSLSTITPAQSILGFTPASAAHEIELENKFKSIPNADEERRQHRIFTQEPHIAGSKRNNELADYIAAEWKKQGLEDVVIHRYDVYGTNPKSASLEMIAPTRYQALLRETPLPATTTRRIPPSAAHGSACPSQEK
jgi:N-acetylated-alpha-linked acidic dipeptidase